MITLTRHAQERILDRSIVTDHDVLNAVNRLESRIVALDCYEVRVIVRRLATVTITPDGSNGDVVVACIDPHRRTIKTVMLTHRYQVASKSKQVPYLEE